MKAILSLVLTICLLCPSVPASQGDAAQQSGRKPTDQQPASAPTPLKEPLAFGLEDGTPVKLRLNRTISSADAHVNDTIDFDVIDEVKVHDRIVIARESMAWGTVTEAEPKRRMGRGGKLNVNIDDVRIVSGEKVPLRAVHDTKGGGHVGAMTGAMVATAIVFFPAAPLFLFMKGKDITIPKGTEIEAYINGDITLDPARFSRAGGADVQAGPASPQPAESVSPAAATGPDASLSSIEIKSTPDAAEITVDDKYMGSTPSTLRLAVGDHKIRLEKQGFKPWEKTLTVNGGGSATVNASLEPQSGP